MILVAFRHGRRVVELCALTWDQIDFSGGMMHVRRVKNDTASVQQIGGEELRALRALKREDGAGRYVFMTERGAPMTPAGFRKLKGLPPSPARRQGLPWSPSKPLPSAYSGQPLPPDQPLPSSPARDGHIDPALLGQ